MVLVDWAFSWVRVGRPVRQKTVTFMGNSAWTLVVSKPSMLCRLCLETAGVSHGGVQEPPSYRALEWFMSFYGIVAFGIVSPRKHHQ